VETKRSEQAEESGKW